MRIDNRLLALLPAPARERVLDASERLSISGRQSLFSAHRRLAYGYFPVDCVISLTVTLESGAIVETGTIGNEGMVAAAILLEDEQCPFDAVCQVPGDLLRVPADVLRAERQRTPELHRLVQRYSLALAYQVAQSSACYRRHPVRQRLSRRLLMTHDRVGSRRIRVTQEMLSEMLGARRADVSAAISALGRSGVLRHHRGLIEILDRQRLEHASCECYAAVQQEYERLLR